MSSRFPRVAVIAASLAACTTTAEGNPIPDRVNSTDTSTSEAPTGDELPSDGAPKVENPIDATHFEQNPCDALTPEQPIDDLEGFPAAIFDTRTDKPRSQCSMTVGLADDLTFQTLTNLSRTKVGKKDPCEAGMLATREMLKTIKANS